MRQSESREMTALGMLLATLLTMQWSRLVMPLTKYWVMMWKDRAPTEKFHKSQFLPFLDLFSCFCKSIFFHAAMMWILLRPEAAFCLFFNYCFFLFAETKTLFTLYLKWNKYMKWTFLDEHQLFMHYGC